MKAIICREWGKPESLVVGERPSSPPGQGQVRIGIHACGVNFADTLIIQGLYQERPAFPFSPGMEVAGEILEVGEGVTHLRVGDRVAAVTGHGGYAEEVVTDARTVFPIPPMMDFVTAAGFAITYGTSHIALAHRARLQPGEVLLVHGAAGGVGLTAVEIGKLLGATVIATASTPEKLALAQRYGADHLINYRQDKFRDRVKEITNGKGADVIYDPVGGDVFDESVRCIAWEGRLLVIGFADGRIPQLPVNLALVKNMSVVGVYWGGYSTRQPRVITDSLRTLLAWYVEGKIRPHISQTYPLGQAADALNSLINRQSTGKVVLTIR
ncbi:MAG: NADPH:quinone oxidoreductase family protein [Chloroflexi bacterium]|nr:NADPH:quinone oxidoreductase family protein [Chloroflexota bacterium]NOG36410.1 NADPH:quinone oxidoreductase family protein [Chloroflexota bacterium]GIK57293.1 MAG: oxidoreductase [Chloroflexota bacterium]